jgi:hypothetical protein
VQLHSARAHTHTHTGTKNLHHQHRRRARKKSWKPSQRTSSRRVRFARSAGGAREFLLSSASTLKLNFHCWPRMSIMRAASESARWLALHSLLVIVPCGSISSQSVYSLPPDLIAQCRLLREERRRLLASVHSFFCELIFG